jgi:hypothetical protein
MVDHKALLLPCVVSRLPQAHSSSSILRREQTVGMNLVGNVPSLAMLSTMPPEHG